MPPAETVRHYTTARRVPLGEVFRLFHARSPFEVASQIRADLNQSRVSGVKLYEDGRLILDVPRELDEVSLVEWCVHAWNGDPQSDDDTDPDIPF